MNEPPTIEHIPNEKRPPKWFWLLVWAVVAGLWLWQLLSGDGFDWEQIALGAGTGGLLVAWAMDLTGGEVPASWRSTPRRD